MASNMKVHAIRLQPDEDMVSSLIEFAKENKIAAGFILSCVGSVKQATLRFAHNTATGEHIVSIILLNRIYKLGLTWRLFINKYTNLFWCLMSVIIIFVRVGFHKFI
jgi:hypothetical protein